MWLWKPVRNCDAAATTPVFHCQTTANKPHLSIYFAMPYSPHLISLVEGSTALETSVRLTKIITAPINRNLQCKPLILKFHFVVDRVDQFFHLIAKLICFSLPPSPVIPAGAILSCNLPPLLGFCYCF